MYPLHNTRFPLTFPPAGMYREKWWDLRGNGDGDEDDSLDFEDEPPESGGSGCSVEDIMTALEGCIMTDLLPLATSLTKTVSGKVRGRGEGEGKGGGGGGKRGEGRRGKRGGREEKEEGGGREGAGGGREGAGGREGEVGGRGRRLV